MIELTYYFESLVPSFVSFVVKSYVFTTKDTKFYTKDTTGKIISILNLMTLLVRDEKVHQTFASSPNRMPLAY